MRLRSLIPVLFCFFVVVTGCVTKSASTSKVGYSEDLEKYRPDFSDSIKTADEGNIDNNNAEDIRTYSGQSIKPTNDITDSLNVFLNTMAEMNKEYDSYTGYTIQVYSGSDRDAANKAKEKVYRTVEDAQPVIEFEAPSWRVRVGKFYDRLDAQKTYNELKSNFSNVIIIPKRFKLSE